MSGGGVLRVGIPASLRKTIQDIKEIAGKHSDEDIYAMLKECNMDPNETAQKLLYLDTFHEVKRKRDKKKPHASNQVPEQNRWTSGTQRRGARGGRGNSSGYFSNDAGGGQRRSPLENGNVGRATAKTGLAGPVHHNTKNDAALSETSYPDDSGKSTSLVTRSSVHGSGTPNSEGTIFEIGHATSAAEINKPTKIPALPNVAVKPLQTSNPGPTPAPTPTIASSATAEAGYQGKVSESTSNDILVSAPVSGVYSSASDPVLLPSLNPRNPGAVGTIKRETAIQRNAPQLSNSSQPEIRFNVCEDGVQDSVQVDPRPMSSHRKTVQGVEKDQHPDPSRLPSLLNHNNESAAPRQDGWSAKQANGSSNGLKQMGATGANMPSLHNVDDSVLGQAPSQLGRKLEGLNMTSQKPVIFPDHVQVPEAYRIGLTFGSLDGSLDNGVSEDAKFVDGTTLASENVTREPSLGLESASVIAHEGEYSGHHQSFPPMPENLSVLEVNGPPAAPEMSEQSKPEIMPPVGASPYPFLHAAPDYGFGVMSPLLAPHLMHVEGTEVANSPVSSTANSTQPLTQTTVGVVQNSASVSPPLFPYLRQPYPSNYFPYPPYLTQLYVPPNAPQFFGPGGFPQQASTGNVYMPSPTAGSGVKFPVPPMYKPGTVPANLTHYGFPSGYGSYGSSPLGYGIGASLAPGSSSSAEDLTAPELKEKNTYPVLKQNEEPHVWTSAPARDFQSLQANFFYNFPAGQQVTYSPAHSGQGSLAGMYHLTPTTATPSTVQSLPQHSQVMVGSVDSVVPPAGSYQQPHSRTGWNTKLLNRENI